MGLHTWFLKNKELYLKQEVLFKELDKHESGEIYLDNFELRQIELEINEINEQNEAEYHDVFRTTKRNEDGTYTNDVIFSEKECNQWLKDNAEHVYFRDSVFDTYEEVAVKKAHKLKRLKEFWKKYPEGVIYFG